MAAHEVTLSLPEGVYEQVRLAAEKLQRRVDDILREAITAIAPVLADATPQARSAFAQMTYLNDAALWQAARSTMSADQRDRLEVLHIQQQRDGLTPDEQREEEALLALYRDTLLVRAQAAVLLKQRGYDVSDPTVFQPLT